jgi:hypothetical protein
MTTSEMRAQLRGTVARGYCHKKNAHKQLDGDLLEAIVDELLLATPSVASPNFRRAEATTAVSEGDASTAQRQEAPLQPAPVASPQELPTSTSITTHRKI